MPILAISLLLAEGEKGGTAEPSLLSGIASILWPLIVLFIIWRFWPVLKSVVESRSFTVEILGVKLSVEDATKKLQSQIEDLQNEFLKLKAGRGGGFRTMQLIADDADARAPIGGGHTAPQAKRILWVDDHPENNVFEAAKLRRDGFIIDQVLSTDEALGELGSRPYQLVISDMGRSTEGGKERSDAGLQLLKLMKEQGILVPVVLFTSATAATRYRLRALTSGAKAIISSPLELFEAVQEVCGRPLDQ
jgi:CheY-like chemotaxis protein